MQARRHRTVRPLTEPRLVQLDDAVFIVGKAVDLPQLHPVHHNRIRFQLPTENRTGDCPADLSVKDAVAGDLVGQFVLEALHIEITHLCIEVEEAERVNRTVQNHIHHRRIDVEHLHADDAVIEEVVAVHTRENSARIAAAIEVNIADRVRVVERPRELYDVVDVARNRLIRRDKRRHILHACTHRIDLKVDAPLTRETNGSIHEPYLTPTALHREIVDADARERSLRTKEQTVERLIQEIPIHRRDAHLNVRIVHVAVHLPREIRQPREMETPIQAIEQGEIRMCTVETQVERRTAHNLPLDAELRSIGELHAEEVDRQIAPSEDKGRVRMFHENHTIAAVEHLRTAVDRRCIRPLSVYAKIGAQRAVEILGHGCRKRTQPRESNAVRREMRRIGLVSCVKDTRARELAVKDLRRQIMERNGPIRIGNIRGHRAERYVIDGPLRRREMPLGHRRRKRPRHMHIRRHSPHV